jgi:hypothetical protein
MAIKFQTHVPVTLNFPFGDGLEISGQYGPQFLYTVEAEGQREKLYATPALHRQLQEAGVGPGRVFTISRVEGDDHRKEWVVEPAPEEAEAPPAGGKKNGQPENSHDPAATPGNGHAVPAPAEFEGLAQLMGGCLRASWVAWNGLEGATFSGEDVRAVGITLFLECSRKGIALAPAPAEVELPF